MLEVAFMKTKYGTYPLIFALKTLRLLQKEYGTFEKWGSLALNEKEPDLDALTFCLMNMINTGLALKAFEKRESYEEVTQDEAEFILQDFGLEKGIQLMCKKIEESLPKISKNAKAAGKAKKSPSISRG